MDHGVQGVISFGEQAGEVEAQPERPVVQLGYLPVSASEPAKEGPPNFVGPATQLRDYAAIGSYKAGFLWAEHCLFGKPAGQVRYAGTF